MNDKDMLHAREYFNKIANICDVIDGKGWWNKPDSVDLTLRDILQNDIEDFIIYLSASDGIVSHEEVNAYRAITGCTDDHFHTKRKSFIATQDFRYEPPFIFKVLSRAEINAIARGARFENSVLGNVMALYRVIGHTVMSADGTVCENEKGDFDMIMQTISDYIEEHDTVAKSYL